MPTDGGELAAPRAPMAPRARRAILDRLTGDRGLPDVLIYGSALRRDFRRTSDVDVLAFDDGATAPYRESLSVDGFDVSLNVVSPATLWEDAALHTFGGYYAAKVVLRLWPASADALRIARHGRELLRLGTRYAGPVHLAAVAAFPAYCAFAATKGLGGSPAGGASGGQAVKPRLSEPHLRSLRRFRREGVRMHEGQPDWWRSYRQRASMPRAWLDDLDDPDG